MDINNFIKVKKSGRNVWQFIVPFIPDDIELTTNVRGEIEAISWFELDKGFALSPLVGCFKTGLKRKIAQLKKKEKGLPLEEIAIEEEEPSFTNFRFTPNVYSFLM